MFNKAKIRLFVSKVNPAFFLLLCLHAPGLFQLAEAQPLEARYNEAWELYNRADFSQARDSLIAIKEVPTLDGQLAQRVHWLLGHVYVMQQNYEMARASIRDWILSDSLEVMADPDRDIPAFVTLFVEEKKKVNEARYCPNGFISVTLCHYGIQPNPGIQRIAVIRFKNLSMVDREKLQPMTELLASDMIVHLLTAQRLTIVERIYLDDLLKQQNINRSDEIDKSTATRVSKLLAANAMIMGHFSFDGKDMAIHARLDDVETGEILGAATFKDRDAQRGRTLQRVAVKLVEVFDDIILQNKHKPGKVEKNELEAILATAEGNAFFDAAYAYPVEVDRSKLIDALASFDTALSFYPGFEPAERRKLQVELAIKALDQTNE